MPDAPDLTHLGRLANLALDDAERERLAQDCAAVLEAFHLSGAEAGLAQRAEACPTFEDKPRPLPPADVERIVSQFPKRDGRHLKA